MTRLHLSWWWRRRVFWLGSSDPASLEWYIQVKSQNIFLISENCFCGFNCNHKYILSIVYWNLASQVCYSMITNSALYHHVLFFAYFICIGQWGDLQSWVFERTHCSATCFSHSEWLRGAGSLGKDLFLSLSLITLLTKNTDAVLYLWI